VANLERYPAEVFAMICESDWEELLRIKHQKSEPQKGTGGLDGTGRRTPALSEKFMRDVESMQSHLAESTVADTLIWKDCVEFRFKRGGLTRPSAMLLPWPLLVKQVADQADVLSLWRKKEDEADAKGEELEVSEQEAKCITDATLALQVSPMNLSLLKDSGVGKILKKLIKVSNNRQYKSVFKRIKMPAVMSLGASSQPGEGKEISVLKQLDRLLQSWMDLAASKGVEGMSNSGKKKAKGQAAEQFQKDDDDLKHAEDCKTWRQLFNNLKDRAEQRRLNLGLKMRENRKIENKMRPKIVKVRPADPRKEAMLDRKAAAASSSGAWARGGSTVASHGGSKILQLRKEASVQGAREKSGLPSFKKQSGFGAAVAFATTTTVSSKQKLQQQMMNRKRKATAAVVALGGGKRMKVPQRAMRMQGTMFGGAKKKPSPGSKR